LSFSGTAQAQTTSQCVDNDGDGWGWGWDGVKSCRTLTTAPLTACIDADGDGWGWDGRKSCLVSDLCIDSDGDGWGWNTTGTCITDVVGSSSVQRLSSFDSFDGSATVRYLDGTHYARTIAADFSTSVWRLGDDSAPTRVSGPAGYAIPEPTEILPFDNSLFWTEITSSSSLVVKRLDREGEVREICTNGISNDGTCEDSIIGDFAFTRATDNTYSVYSFGVKPVAVLDKGEFVTRPILSPAGEEIYMFATPTELNGRLFFTGYTDSDLNYRVWSADSNMRDVIEIFGPDGTGIKELGGGYRSLEYYLTSHSKDNNGAPDPKLFYTDGSGDLLNAISIDTNTYFNIGGAIENRVFIIKGEDRRLYSINLSDGSETNYNLNYVRSAYTGIQPHGENAFYFYTCESSRSCSDRTLYLTIGDSAEVRVIDSNVDWRVALQRGVLFYSKNKKLYKAGLDGVSTLIRTGEVEVVRILNSDDQGVYFVGDDPISGNQIYIYR